MRFARFLSLLATSILVAFGASAGELRVVSTRYIPGHVGGLDLDVVNANKQPNGNIWDVFVDSPKQLYATVRAQLKGTQAPYVSGPLTFRFLFKEKSAVSIELAAVKEAVDSAYIPQELFALNLDDRDTPYLTVVYQRARNQALGRVEEVESGKRQFGGADAKALFVFLKVTNTLVDRVNLLPDAEVIRAKNFLRSRVDDNANRVLLSNSLGDIELARKVIRLIDFVEARHFQKLFDRIKSMNAPRTEACAFFRALGQLIEESDKDVLVRMASLGSNARSLTVEAVNDCVVAEQAELKQQNNSEASKKAVEARIETTIKAISGEPSAFVQRRLDKQLRGLRGL